MKNAIPAMKHVQNVGAKDMPDSTRTVPRFATNAAAMAIWHMGIAAALDLFPVRDVMAPEIAKPVTEQEENQMIDDSVCSPE